MATRNSAARAAPQPGSLERVSPQAWLVLFLSAGSMVIVSFNLTGTNLAFAAIQETFDGVSRATLSWALSGYSIALATFMLIAGRLADRLGRRRVFLTGTAVLAAASAATAASPTALVFVLGRLGQGVGAAMITPSSLALALPMFPAGRKALVVSAWTACNSVGAASAPSISAFVVNYWHWRAVYLLGMPIALAVLVAGPRLLREAKGAPGQGALDYVGVPMGTAAVGLLALAIVQGRSWGWTSPGILTAFAGAAVLAPVFVRRSLRHPQPLLDLRLFALRPVWAANLGNVFLSMVGLSTWLVWPLFLQQIWGYSIVQAGLAITPAPINSAFWSLYSGRVTDRKGPKGPVTVGCLLPAAATAWAVWRVGAEPNYLTDLLPSLLLFSAGFGLTFSPLNAAALRGVPADTFGQVNAAFQTIRALAGGLGTALAVMLLGERTAIPLANFTRVFLVFAVVALLGAAMVQVFYPRNADQPPAAA
ncbi:MAG: MFS transporter [Acidimicrobiales bacterium]